VRPGAVAVIAAALALTGATASASSVASPAVVNCESIVDPVGSFTWAPKRVALGVVAVPPAFVPQTFPAGGGRWPYWSKAGLVVRADSPPVRVTVPARWKARAAIQWGDSGAVDDLRISTCPPSSSLGAWSPYAGGFLLRSRSACVPLTFRARGQSVTVRFGVGRRCR
jgi:hypothetical protein